RLTASADWDGRMHDKKKSDRQSPDLYPFHLITQGHRAIELAARPDVRPYTRSEFRSAAQRISYAFWMDTFMPLLRRSASEKIASRLTAATKRAHANAHVYGTRMPGREEVATEVFFDGRLVKPREYYRSRTNVHHHLRSIRQSKAPLR